MPEATVYQCDKTEGLEGKHRKCGREIGDETILIDLLVRPKGGVAAEEKRTHAFCGRVHANYWLIRQRVARDSE